MFILYHQFEQTIQFHDLHQALAHHLGFVFLQDHHHPVLACLPKQLQLLTTTPTTTQQTYQRFIRQADFSYQSIICDQIIIEPHTVETHTTTNINQETTNDVSFTGGYIAFISYDYAAQQHIASHPSYQHTHHTTTPVTAQPSAIIAEYDIFFKYQHNHWNLYCHQDLQQHPILSQLVSDIAQRQSIDKHNTIEKTKTNTHAPLILQEKIHPRWDKADYQQAFQHVQDYLHAGDCYQINLTQEFYTDIQSGRLLSIMDDLFALSQAPYSAYIAWQDFELLSCSPELFIEFQLQRKIITRPIKGTLPRHQQPLLDQQLKQRLANSTKDQAENVMIVDLLRNDFSLYAKAGSVHVPVLFEIESFQHVHHMVSEIHATLDEHIQPWQMLLSALPGGSITGAPKIRAMQIIQEIEQHPRGAYCGSIGYLNYDGTGRFNILIRTLQRYQNRLSIWAGGGITVASDCDAEYQECLDKVQAIIDQLNSYSQKTLE